MKWMNRSIRNRILSGFLMLTLLIILLSSISFYYLQKTTRIRALDEGISNLQIQTLHLIKTDNEFYDLETINPNYHETRNSLFLKQRDSLQEAIMATTRALKASVADLNTPLLPDLINLSAHLDDYNQRFKDLEELIYQIGYKDYGTIGRMRSAAHQMEDDLGNQYLADILQLRRHEKDFLLRNELVYADKLNNLSREFASRLAKEDNEAEAIMVNVLIRYTETFNELVELHKAIGLTSNHGLRHDLNLLTNKFDQELKVLVQKANTASRLLIRQGTYIFAITVLGTIVAALLLSYIISNNISSPIRRLYNLMDKSMSQPGAEKQPHESRANTAEENEVSKLTETYFKLINRTRQQFEEIREKSIQLGEQNEALHKVNQELDRFLYSVAHDLRSPLTSVLGLLRLARIDSKDEQMNKYITMMESSIKNMEKFIKDIVDYAKNKKLEVTPEELDLHSMIEKIMDDHRYIEGADVIDKVVESEGISDFYSDRNRLYIIFQNLISNAIRYHDADKESPYVRVRIFVTEQEATFYFEDNGIGIDKEHQEKVFGMFFRANEKSTGSGLGLYLLVESLKKLGGQISLDSSPGVGTTFKLIVPNLKRTMAHLPNVDAVPVN